MQLYPELRIQTAVEAMNHTIIPALDTNNALAQQQAQLIVAMLDQAAGWLKVQYSYDKNELTRLAATANNLIDQVRDSLADDPAVPELDEATEHARDVLARAGAGPHELRDSIRTINAALGAVVASAYATKEFTDKRVVEKAAIDLTAELHPFVRSAYRGHGFEGDPALIPSVEQLLDRTTIDDPRRNP